MKRIISINKKATIPETDYILDELYTAYTKIQEITTPGAYGRWIHKIDDMETAEAVVKALQRKCLAALDEFIAKVKEFDHENHSEE